LLKHEVARFADALGLLSDKLVTVTHPGSYTNS
jgi:hypothetical protein